MIRALSSLTASPVLGFLASQPVSRTLRTPKPRISTRLPSLSPFLRSVEDSVDHSSGLLLVEGGRASTAEEECCIAILLRVRTAPGRLGRV